MKEKEAARKYFLELFAGLALYIAILLAALHLGRQMAPGLTRTLVMLSPMLGFLVALWAIVRQFGRMDEFVRRQTLENIAVAGAVTAGWTFTYGFLETAGYPRISMFTVWPVFGAVWGGLACIRRWFDR